MCVCARAPVCVCEWGKHRVLECDTVLHPLLNKHKLNDSNAVVLWRGDHVMLGLIHLKEYLVLFTH